MKRIVLWCMLVVFPGVISCKEEVNNVETNNPDISTQTDLAEVISVTVSGGENQYTLSVGIQSPDTGCEQYADWWEVITLEGELLYRRILAHSHVNEQPFIRSGGAVEMKKDQEVYIRAHMNNNGYGTRVYKGSVQDGFVAVELNKDFAKDLTSTQPLPNGCAF